MSDDRWQDLVERTQGADVTPGTMFGCRGMRTGRKFFAIWWDDQLVVKLPAGRLQELIAAGEGEMFEPMPGRQMSGWAVLGGTVEWDPVVTEARAWTESQQ